jgi:hypothetical protein
MLFSILQVGVVPVTAEPGDQGAADAAARGYLRASHGDREHVIDVLKVAFVHGMLTKAELDARVGQVLAARTYADLAALTADLPAGLARTQPVRKPARAKARPPVSVAVILCPAGIFASVGVVHAALIGNERLFIALIMPAFISLVAWMVAGVMMADSWHQKRSRGQLPPPPAPGGHAVEGGQGGQPGNDLMLCQAHSDTRAHRLLSGLARKFVGGQVQAVGSLR